MIFRLAYKVFLQLFGGMFRNKDLRDQTTFSS